VARVSNTSVDLTPILSRTVAGDAGAREQLAHNVYDHLRRLARRQMAGERPGHTLTATALVHEAFLKLVDQERASYQDRAHFLAVAALTMRRVLVSHARKRSAGKRGSGQRAVTLDDQIGKAGLALDDVISLDRALFQLSELSARQAAVFTYRAFAAMTDAEIADVLDVSVPTVRRDYRLAVAWLRRELRP
jgi:RNA polymerase sigma factor (TIGR02999 family)